MRAALAALTLRGRCFAAAGGACIGCAVALSEVDLLRVGIFLLALPVTAAVAVIRTRYRLSCSRRVEPRRVSAGHRAVVRLRVHNVSLMPTGLLLVEDHLPYALGGRPRFVLERLEPRGVRELEYPVRSDMRGRFRIGPLAVRLTDPFGLVELVRSFTATDHIVVSPSFADLQPVRLGGGGGGGGDANARIIASAGEDDVATREYRHGDDLRRVHWRSTAHYGELMVRREEQFWQNRGSLLLDARSSVHRGSGPGSSFEWAVSATASIGVHLARHRYDLRFVTDSGSTTAGFGGPGAEGFEGPLLDTLAVLQTSRNRSLRDATAVVRQDGAEDLLIAVLGAVDETEAEHLAGLGGRGVSRVAVLMNTASWVSLSPTARARAETAFDTSAHVLYRAGWRVLPVHAGDRIEGVWPRVQHRTAPKEPKSETRTGVTTH